MSALYDNICAEYGVRSPAEICITNPSLIMDSVQDGWCIKCGELGDHVEPDAEGYKCDHCGLNKVASLQMIVLFS